MLSLLRRKVVGVPRAARSYASSPSPGALKMWLSKGQGLLHTSLYYTKVAGELAKYVWVKEGMSPPTVAQVQQTFTNDAYKLLNSLLAQVKQPAAFFEKVKTVSKSDTTLYGAAAIQLLGLFSLGEIIGRRHVYGYKHY